MIEELEAEFNVLYEMQENLSREGRNLYQENSFKNYSDFKIICKTDKDFSKLLYSFRLKFQDLILKLLDRGDLCSIAEGYKINFLRFETPFTYNPDRRTIYHRATTKKIRYSYLYF